VSFECGALQIDVHFTFLNFTLPLLTFHVGLLLLQNECIIYQCWNLPKRTVASDVEMFEILHRD